MGFSLNMEVGVPETDWREDICCGQVHLNRMSGDDLSGALKIPRGTVHHRAARVKHDDVFHKDNLGVMCTLQKTVEVPKAGKLEGHFHNASCKIPTLVVTVLQRLKHHQDLLPEETAGTGDIWCLTKMGHVIIIFLVFSLDCQKVNTINELTSSHCNSVLKTKSLVISRLIC